MSEETIWLGGAVLVPSIVAVFLAGTFAKTPSSQMIIGFVSIPIILWFVFWKISGPGPLSEGWAILAVMKYSPLWLLTWAAMTVAANFFFSMLKR